MNRNAIIMAAGMSTRFVPLSLEIPKALLKVKGEVLIERQICQLKEAGIEEIVIVVGYMKEQFQYLTERYGVILIENPVYHSRNNHSTLYVAREYLKDTFICSGDNYFTENVFQEESKHSYYAAVYEKGITNEWCILTDDLGKIERVEIGGRDSWIMKGHAYFTKEFSNRLVPYLVKAYADAGSAGKFWEEIYMENIHGMDMYIHKYDQSVIEEFDSIEELRMFDEAYINHTGSRILENISRELDCQESGITHICPVKERGRAVGVCFECKGHKYVYSFKTRLLKEQEEVRDGE